LSKLKHALNIGLVLVSLLCALVTAEFALRGMLFSDVPLFAGLSDASLFSHRVPDRDGDFYGEDYWKLRWIFKHKNNIQEPQPLLGWWGFFDPRTLVHHQKEQVDRNPPEIRSYLFNLLRNSLGGVFPEADRAAAIKAQSKTLNTRILKGVLQRLDHEEIEHVILVFHPQHHRADDWRLVFLREACERHGAECLFDEDIRAADVQRRGGEHDPFRYALPNDGHPTSYANQLVARELAAIIAAADHRR